MRSAVAAATAAAAAIFSEDGAKRAVFAHAVRQSRDDGPPATRKYARVKHVRARSENEQDNEYPETAVAL